MWSMFTHICGHQLLSIIDAQHSDFTLTDERIVVWIGGYQQHLWNETQAGSAATVTVIPVLVF